FIDRPRLRWGCKPLGISSVLDIHSLLGFVLFLAGIGAVVVAASQGRPVRGGVLLAEGGLIRGLVFTVISQAILVGQPTEVAVRVNTLTGELEGTPRRGGTHIIVPVIQEPFLYPVTQQNVALDDETSNDGEGAAVARSSDGQEV